MVRARLRTAFHYPSDSDSDSLPAHMDEEDTSTNELYSTLFSLLFVLPAIYSLLILLRSPTLVSFLVLSSLGITVYTVKFIPVLGGDTSLGAEGEGDMGIRGGGGPIEKFLPVLNGVLAVVVGLGTYVQKSKGDGIANGREMRLEAWAGYLPLVVYTMSIIVRYAMTPIDLSELEKTKYKYKGA
ncbi:hypothetical protein BGX38DRAFT_1138466 [Terfezia claveryi]|nr:hypothetical protein BGX38DRAFT_1138466 [Terfezia claveryi]